MIDTTLKDMLVSLCSTPHSDIMSLTQQIKAELHAVNDRVSHIESKMGEFASPFDEQEIAHNERKDDLPWINATLADLEKRSR